ncbi:MAG: hypothetical protein KDE27_24515 [Planctomycetes bacterium]|nr:hypothetical protein [Planctomycetota bacterium]
MGERELLAARATLIALLPTLAAFGLGRPTSAQGPVYRERWGYMQLERLRDTVARELAGRDGATRAQIAETLAEPVSGLPFGPVARALARLRGVEADDAFLLRATLGVFLLPEVVDPDASNEVCRRLNASLFLPYTVPEPGVIEFVATVRDAGGATVFETTVTKATAVGDLRRARPVVQVTAAELPDGAYELAVAARIDGRDPGPKDPLLRLGFHVLRGYQARAEAAMTAARELGGELEPRARGLLLGIGAEVSRAYQGEAFCGESDAVRDLERFERALANVRDDREVLDGLHGDVPIQLAVGDDLLAGVLRLDPDRRAAGDGQPPRPLVVFAAGLPAYDNGTSRPSSPRTGEPRQLAVALRDFGRGADYDVAFLESPGAGRRYGAALAAALPELRAIFGTGSSPVVLVCEREAGSVAGLAIGEIRDRIDGIVFVGAGAMTGDRIDGLGDLPVRAVLLAGYPPSLGLERVLDYVAGRRAAGGTDADFALLTEARPAWPFGLREIAGQLDAFVRGIAK